MFATWCRAYEEQLSQRRWIEAFLSSMMWRTPQSRWRGLLWRHYWVLYKDLPTRETITATRKQRWKRGLGWLTEDQTFWRTLSQRGQTRMLHRVITCLIVALHTNTFFELPSWSSASWQTYRKCQKVLPWYFSFYRRDKRDYGHEEYLKSNK